MLKVPNVIRFLLTISAVALGMSGLTSVAQAQGADEEIEEIVVSGLRGKPRTAVDSAVPIDTFDSDMIEAVAHTDVQDILQTLIPSYNVSREPISDGSSFIRPARLRGLPTHHTLVLINGKRRQSTASADIARPSSASAVTASRAPTWRPSRHLRFKALKYSVTAPPPSTVRTPSPA